MSQAPRYPYPITAYAVILLVSMMHIYKAAVIISTTCADNNIPLHALLTVMPERAVLSIYMFGASIPALWAIWREDHEAWITSILVVPQGVLLLITAFGAYSAFWNAHYVNFDPGCASFIGTDQYWRAVLPLAYVAAVYQKIRESSFNSAIRKHSPV
jgi:hypothetical protein